jgi:hypothetical protein
MCVWRRPYYVKHEETLSININISHQQQHEHHQHGQQQQQQQLCKQSSGNHQFEYQYQSSKRQSPEAAVQTVQQKAAAAPFVLLVHT